MVELVWEFIVREEGKGQYELVFGPGGGWSNLYSSSPGFRGTTVMRDIKNPLRYLIFDLWDSEIDRENVLDENPTGYSELETTLDKLTESKSKLGTFNVIAQATVRPQRRTRSSKP